MQRTYRHRILRTIADGALSGVGTTHSPVWDLAEVSQYMPAEHIGFERMGVFIRISAVTGTTPTMEVSFEISEDGTNWEAITPAALTGLNTAGVRTSLNSTAYPARFVRLRYVLGGTTPSFTFEARVKVMA